MGYIREIKEMKEQFKLFIQDHEAKGVTCDFALEREKQEALLVN